MPLFTEREENELFASFNQEKICLYFPAGVEERIAFSGFTNMTSISWRNVVTGEAINSSLEVAGSVKIISPDNVHWLSVTWEGKNTFRVTCLNLRTICSDSGIP